jgi:hypothetical protein
MTITLLYAVACGGPPKKPVDLENDQVENDPCCCRWVSIGSEKGQASYAETNRMECSLQQGECMAASNCAAPRDLAP